MKSKNDKKNEMKWWHWMILFVLVCIVIFWVWYCYRANLLEVCDSERGTNGDMFGGLTALFSGFAFAGIILTIIMQSQELKLQRDEMIDTRDVFKQQTFENTFFQLLRTQLSITDSMDLHKKSKNNELVDTGRDCFKTFYSNYRSILFTGNGKLAPEEIGLEDAKEGYMKFYKRHQSDIGHYFRHLYHIIKFIHESDIPNKKRYTGIVRAQLSSYELGLLFYNCLVDFDIDEKNKFKPLIEEYKLLKSIDDSLIINKQHCLGYNQMGAFGRVINV
jgi:hypothetical protein